jgi:nucleoside-diphosphate-sugar epimerase
MSGGEPRVLITGGTGFIGALLARRLHAQGRTVRVFARPSSRGEELRRDGIEFVPGDLRNPADVDRAVTGCTLAFHLGAQYRKEGVPLEEFRGTNIDGTRNLLDSCVRHRIERLVHVSTVGVYGTLEELPATEDHRIAPIDHYQRTKQEAEALAAAMMRNELGRCEVLYHPTYIDDALDGLELAATHPSAPGNIYNLAGAGYLPLREYVRTVAGVLGVAAPRHHMQIWPLKVASHVLEKACRPFGIEPPLFPRRLTFFHSNRAFSIDKARRELGYAPQIQLEEGMRRTAA